MATHKNEQDNFASELKFKFYATRGHTFLVIIAIYNRRRRSWGNGGSRPTNENIGVANISFRPPPPISTTFKKS